LSCFPISLLNYTLKIMRNDFAAFILSHGRPDKIHTIKSLQRAGYSGRYFIVIDDEDNTADDYRAKYSDKVLQFNKKSYADLTDEGDNFENRRTTTHARNAIFDLAREQGCKFFIALDDDYTDFVYKYNDEACFAESHILSIDSTFDLLIDYLEATQALSIAMAQNGDFIGGACGTFAKHVKPKRKAMNTFICSTDRPFQFISRLNEDVNTYLTLGHRGKLFFTIPQVSIIQKQTQATKGGMTEAYLEGGTYVKTFYSVMYCPSFVKVSMMGEKHRRIHHRVTWKNAVPVILSEDKKQRQNNE